MHVFRLVLSSDREALLAQGKRTRPNLMRYWISLLQPEGILLTQLTSTNSEYPRPTLVCHEIFGSGT